MDLTNPQSLNRYAYVNNNAVNASDSLGLDWSWCDGSSCVVEADQDVGWAPLLGVAWGGTDVAPNLIYFGGRKGAQAGASSLALQPQSSTLNICNVAQRGRLLAESAINYLIGQGKVGAAKALIAAAPESAGTSLLLGVGATISASGNFVASSAQLAGALTGKVEEADEAAAAATAATSVTGVIVLATTGNLERAKTMSAWESLFTTGVKGGMTGQLIERGIERTEQLLAGTELGQNLLEAAGVSTQCAPSVNSGGKQ